VVRGWLLGESPWHFHAGTFGGSWLSGDFSRGRGRGRSLFRKFGRGATVAPALIGGAEQGSLRSLSCLSCPGASYPLGSNFLAGRASLTGCLGT
jgi:hypothetical protein